MFKMGTPGAVFGLYGISILSDLDARLAGIHHRLYSDDHPRHELFSLPCFSKIWDIRIFVKSIPDAVPDEIFGQRELGCLNHISDRFADVSYMISRLCCIDARLKGRLCDIQKLSCFIIYRPHADSHC